MAKRAIEPKKKKAAPQLRRPGDNPAAVSVMFYGEPGCGKSTAARDWGRCLGGETYFIAPEDSMADLECIEPARPDSWTEAEEAKDYFLDDLDPRQFPCAALETVDKLADLAEQHLLEEGQVDSINLYGGGYGAGHKKLGQMIDDYLNDFIDEGRGLILVSHCKLDEIMTPSRSVLKRCPTLTGKAGKAAKRIVGNIFLISHPHIDTKKQVTESTPSGKTRKRSVIVQEFLDKWDGIDKLPDGLQPSDRVIATTPTNFWEAKFRSDGVKFPMFIPLLHPADGNTVQPLFDFMQKARRGKGGKRRNAR